MFLSSLSLALPRSSGSLSYDAATAAAYAAASAAGGNIWHATLAPGLTGFAYTDSAGTIQAAATNVLGNWKSREGSAVAATQATEANKPILTTQANGYIAPVWNTTDRMLAPKVADGAKTYIIAGKMGAALSVYLLDSDSAARQYLQVESNGRVSTQAGVNLLSATGVVAFDSKFVIKAVFNGASSEISYNGTVVAAGNAGSNNPVTNVTVGANFSFSAPFVGGAICLFAQVPGVVNNAAPYTALANILVSGL